MARVLLTMLGTSDYYPCNYILNEKEKTENIRFIQEAIAKQICKRWTKKDRIIIFLTDEAKKKNWQDNGHFDRDGKPLQREGLKKRFDMMNLPVQIIPRNIPLGATTDELWTIFMEIYNQIQDQDEIYLDITHALRFLPMLTLIVLNYTEVMKKITVEKIYYGAFEALGTIREIEKLSLENKNVPILDLTTFIQLFEWSKATHNFLAFGDAKELKEITIKYVTPDLIKSKGQHQEAKTASKSAMMLMDLTEKIKTCRLYDLITNENHDSLQKQLQICKNEYLQPLQPLLEKIEEKIAEFHQDDIQNGFAAVKWCINHDLIQQGLTLLQETVISYFVKEHFGYEMLPDKDKRELIAKAFNIASRSIPECKWKIHHSKKQTIRQIIASLDRQLVSSYIALSKARNDINHAGFIEPKTASRLRSDLLQHYESLRAFCL